MKASVFARLRLARLFLLGIAAASLPVGTSSSVGAATAGVAPVSTGLPRIGGPVFPLGVSPEVLHVSTGSWTGSPTAYRYQWLLCTAAGSGCARITAATTNSYEPVPDDIGHTVRAVVTASNAAGSASAASTVYPPVSSLAPRNILLPHISGTPKQGSTLSTSRGSWSGAPTLFKYLWLRCTAKGRDCAIVCPTFRLVSCSSHYLLALADAGSTVRGVIVASNHVAAGVAVSHPYPANGVIAGLPPTNTSSPAVTGTAIEGYTLTASQGSWSNLPTTFRYQWQRCDASGSCSDIAGASSSSYLLGVADVLHTLRVVVTASNRWGSASATSPPTSLTVGGAVSAGIAHVCAVASDGSVWCWGHGGYGELGDGGHAISQEGHDSSTPVQVKGVNGVGTLSHVVQVTAGDMFSCALLTGGTVDCWGKNDVSQLGYRGRDSSTPVPIAGLPSRAVEVSAGGGHTCALLDDGTVACWGSNGFEMLGGGNLSESSYSRPIRVVGVGGTDLLSHVVQVSVGGLHTCALLDDGSVVCWGWDAFGQLGDGAVLTQPGMPVYSGAPVRVKGLGGVGGLSGVRQVSAGWIGSCALRDDGTVDCWGTNGIGQPGAPTYESGGILSLPVKISAGPLGQILEVSAGFYSACALVDDGTVDCWGSPGAGDLGDGKPIGWSGASWIPTPSRVVGPGGAGALSGVTEVSTGQEDACALSAERTVWCWGLNEFGQLGNGVPLPGNNSSIPVKVSSFGATDTLSPP